MRLGSFARDRPVPALVVSVVICELVGASGAVFTSTGLMEWYPGLVKPGLTPPNWVFGPVWTSLFLLMGVAAWLVWRRYPRRQGAATRALGLFAAQFVLNVAWSAAFFGAQSPLAGLIVIAGLWLLIVATIQAFLRVDSRAGLLLTPYIVWVSFAAYLNLEIWRLN